MLPRLFSILACLYGFSFVALSALASHVFQLNDVAKHRLEQGLTILIVHAFALLLVRSGQKNHEFSSKLRPVQALAGLLFCLGSLLFCGSLIATALGASTGLLRLAPFGGALLMLGWLVWALHFFRAAQS